MSDHSGLTHLQGLFEAALNDYEKQTGIALAKHPLASQLQDCDSVESLTAVLYEQTQAFNEFQGRDKIMKPFKNVLSILYKLSATLNLGQDFGLVSRRPWLFVLSDPNSIAFPTCKSITGRPRSPTLCMCFTLVLSVLLLTSKCIRWSKASWTTTIR